MVRKQPRISVGGKAPYINPKISINDGNVYTTSEESPSNGLYIVAGICHWHLSDGTVLKHCGTQISDITSFVLNSIAFKVGDVLLTLDGLSNVITIFANKYTRGTQRISDLDAIKAIITDISDQPSTMAKDGECNVVAEIIFSTPEFQQRDAIFLTKEKLIWIKGADKLTVELLSQHLDLFSTLRSNLGFIYKNQKLPIWRIEQQLPPLMSISRRGSKRLWTNKPTRRLRPKRRPGSKEDYGGWSRRLRSWVGVRDQSAR
ncbi:hypothetical protein BKA67DRAFT_533771 [Truncatella angustata]|uniref:Uncharacterized protein n=1 Tax=Truncatella angustata TaxID=152316 RepID=A0A9P8UT54_9PEZI|nr:uncharacterized protein BKA67DRAFT_533771 [Truncatella angustata]KAH6658645.1 hypothetical protein BKA67DRAFT_533771 [Truncatella angustata]